MSRESARDTGYSSRPTADSRFGSQYTQLIARRIREVGVYCEIVPWDTSDAEISGFKPSGIILSGGPESVTAPGSPART